MKEFNELELQDTDELKIIYIHYVGQDCDGLNIYHFLISENSEDAWQEGWEEIPACNMHSLKPNEDMYDYVKELKTDITFDLAQDNCCFSMSDCKDRCVALASENITEYEEYPANGRIVIQFGETLTDIERMLGRRDLFTKYI